MKTRFPSNQTPDDYSYWNASNRVEILTGSHSTTKISNRHILFADIDSDWRAAKANENDTVTRDSELGHLHEATDEGHGRANGEPRGGANASVDVQPNQESRFQYPLAVSAMCISKRIRASEPTRKAGTPARSATAF